VGVPYLSYNLGTEGVKRYSMVMTPKKKRFVKALASGQVDTYADAARVAGYAETNAKHHGSWLMRNDQDVRAAVLHELHTAGVTEELLAEKMRDGLDALTPPKKEGGSRYEDFFVRKQYADMAYKLMGAYAPEKRESVETKIVVNLTPNSVSRLADSDWIDAEEVEEIKGDIIKEENISA
jgi:hypothetical protein